MTKPSSKPVEVFPSPPNRPPGKTISSKLLFFLRRVLDFQVQSVLLALTPWLAKREGLLLEVGCGAQPYRHLVHESCRYLCLDWVGAMSQFGYRAPQSVLFDGGEFPFQNGVFDGIFHTEVLEHVWDCRRFLSECRRVLKPGGVMFLSVPFQARYHYIPHDYWRFTPSALNRLLEESGFQKICVQPRGTDITVAAYKVITLFYRWASSGSMAKITLSLVMSPLLLLCLFVGHFSLFGKLGSPDDTLGYIVTAQADEPSA
ncbi:MAG: methyltransferase domain-containing protein [Magnetococcales bacterium]|nr:methyltransferase domain-containing protein [Magnetococcales bacterium]